MYLKAFADPDGVVFPGERAASVARAWVRPSSAGVTPLLQPGPTSLPLPTRDQDSDCCGPWLSVSHSLCSWDRGFNLSVPLFL